MQIVTCSTDVNVNCLPEPADWQLSQHVNWMAGDLVHIAFVFDIDKTGGKSHRVFIDGQEHAFTENDIPTTYATQIPGNYTQLGNEWAISGRTANGVIDNFVVYDYAKLDFSDRFNESPLTTNFSAFYLTQVKVRFLDEYNDFYKIKGELVLDGCSNGIDPVSEEVVVLLGTSTLEIPAGSYHETRPGKFVFDGVIDGISVESKIKLIDSEVYLFKVVTEGIDLSDTSNPINLELVIGDDKGETEVRLEGTLKDLVDN